MTGLVLCGLHDRKMRADPLHRVGIGVHTVFDDLDRACDFERRFFDEHPGNHLRLLDELAQKHFAVGWVLPPADKVFLPQIRGILFRNGTETDILLSRRMPIPGASDIDSMSLVPELPEMQALAERLDEQFAGAKLQRVMPLQFSSLKTVTPMYDTLNGQKLIDVGRRGKFLVLELERARVLVHLSQGGRVDIEKQAKTTRAKGSVVRFAFDQGGLLVKEFGTERKAAWWVLGAGEEGPLSSLGPEPGSDAFAALIRDATDTRRIHTMLRDQHTVSGIGRGYADDILHRARLSPYATLASLDAEQRETLLDAVDEVLEEGLTAERKRAGGLPTKIGDHWIVHGRYGSPCPRCGSDLRRVSYESHEVTYCPTCQTGGKVLADRRMSRLIK